MRGESILLHRLRNKAKRRHSEAPFAEESLILLTLKPREIPRGVYSDTGGARNDGKREFFRDLYSLIEAAVTEYLVEYLEAWAPSLTILFP